MWFICLPIVLLFAAHPQYAFAADLDDVLAHTLQHHPAIQAERQTLGISRSEISEAFSGFMPRLAVNYDRGRQRQVFNNQQAEYNDAIQRTLSISQPLFRGGETVAEYQASRARYRAQRARLQLVEQDVLLSAVTAYIELAEAKQLLNVSHENVRLLQEQLQGANERLRAQELTVTDVSLSESRLLRAQAELNQAQGNYEAAKKNYRRATLLEPEDINLPPVPVSVLPKSLDEVLAMTAGHPAMTAARQQHKAAQKMIDASRAAFLPDVSLEGSMRDEKSPSSVSFINSVDEDRIMLRVAIPVYQGGLEYAQLRGAKYASKQALYQVSDTELEIEQNAKRAWVSYQASRDTRAATQKSIGSTEKALTDIRKEFGYGMRTTLDVLNTQTELYGARGAYVRAKAQEALNAYELLAATGQMIEKLRLMEFAEQAVSRKVATTKTTITNLPKKYLLEPVTLDLPPPK